MKIELLPYDEFVEINHLKEVTSPVLLQRGEVPHPEGIISNEIFGVTIKERKETYAYIDLHGHFLHPHVYKVMKRFFRNVDKIISGTESYTIDKEGHLVVDPNGETGIEWMYENWNKIKWEYTESSARNERIDLITKSKRSEIFTTKQVVIPPFYRDISSTKGGGGSIQDINNMYIQLIRLTSLLKDKDMFMLSFYSTAYNVQTIMEDIYNYFKLKLEKKNGILRKYLMGKNVDNCVRTVITASDFHAEKPDELKIDYYHAGLPISQVCALATPFVANYVKRFFEREFIDNAGEKQIFDSSGKVVEFSQIANPESTFSDKFIKKKIDQFIKDPETRFEPIEIPMTNGRIAYPHLKGRIFSEANKDEVSSIINRKMTWTDILYIACVETTKDKFCIVTRYPISDKYGIFINKIQVISTRETMPVQIGNTVYPFYPIIDFTLPKNKVTNRFIDSTQFSHSYLKGLGGDYDGDQTTIKIIWTQEANKECEKYIASKSNFLSVDGNLIRTIGNEAMQTFYSLTKHPIENSKTVTKEERDELLKLKSEDFTFSKLVELLGSKGENGENKAPKFIPEDIITIPKDSCCHNSEDLKTTVGRYIFNRILVEGTGLDKIYGYINDDVTKKVFGKFESAISQALLLDKIDTATMVKYINTRDWLGLQLHAVITISFTMNTITIHPEVQKLKDELLKKYSKELAANDPIVAAEIEKQLIAKTKEVLKDDVGLDLYYSGARGSLENNYKNIALMRGSIYNRQTGGFDVVTNSLNDGLAVKDIPASHNSLMEGAYPKAVGTAESGYAAKKLLAACQTETLDERGSDCGAKNYIRITLTDSLVKKLTWRYIMVGSKPVLLTPEVIKNYIGKEVKLRSPQVCIGKKLCNICAGDFYYMVDDMNIGLSASKIATTLTNLNMKKFHDNVIHFKKIDPEDMLM